MKVVIYNDTTHAFNRTHFGCQLVMESMRDLLSEFEIIGTIPLNDCISGNVDHALLSEADLVIANGEGSYHHNRRPDFAKLSRQYPTALINTVYEDNDDDLSDFLYIAARESKSAELISKQVSCDLVPDVIFTSKYLEGFKPSKGKGVVSVQHYPQMSQYKGITGYNRAVSTMQDKKSVIPQIASSDSIMTGSFHAGCVAAYYEKPVSLSESNTHKMQGLAADMGIDYESGKMETVDPDYVPMAQKQIHAMIDKLKRIN